MIRGALFNIAKYDSPNSERYVIPCNLGISFNYFAETIGNTSGELKRRVPHLAMYYIRKKYTRVEIFLHTYVTKKNNNNLYYLYYWESLVEIAK